MFPKKSKGPSVIRLISGDVFSVADLPPVTLKRWTASRKRAVVRAVIYNIITAQEAIDAYALSQEEFNAWLARCADHGEDALKETKIKIIDNLRLIMLLIAHGNPRLTFLRIINGGINNRRQLCVFY